MTSDTRKVLHRDVDFATEVQLRIQDLSTITSLSETDFWGLAENWYGRLHRLRMGGRSLALAGMSIMLWNGYDRPTIDIDVEEYLATVLRIGHDPSFVQPEWAIILSGVLIARYSNKLPQDAAAEILEQCRLLLRNLEISNPILPPARTAASRLLEAWDEGFCNGLEPVVSAAYASWPTTEGLGTLAEEKLESLVADIDTRLPTCWSERERRIYRLHMERKGIWGVLERVSLK